MTNVGYWVPMADQKGADDTLYYLLAQSYSPHTLSGGLTQAWTLTIEVAFYAFLPVYAWIQRRIPARTRTAVLRSEIIGLLVLIVSA